MVKFSTDPKLAERQMQAIIFYLTTFGYIDGDFDESEREFVLDYIRKLVEVRVATGMPNADDTLRAELVGKFTTHFHEVFEGIDRHVRELFTEAVAKDEDQDAFIHAKLKLRCFELFQDFDEDNQKILIEAMDDLIAADGELHPAELKFRNELIDLFESDIDIDIAMTDGDKKVRVTDDPIDMRASQVTHPFFDQFEHHYSADPETIKQQIQGDRKLIDTMIDLLEKQAAKGAGKLGGMQKVDAFIGQEPFLDGHTYVHPIDPDGPGYELTVLGDVHGCYSCLKGAVMQADFFAKVAAYKANPTALKKPVLVLLGDYIDRGMFSLNGVLRSVMQIFCTAPDHVYVLRGNHEYYLEYKGQIFGGVKPAEAINTLKPHLPVEVFQHYMRLFDKMPNVLLFGRTMFVHAGIPRDRLVKEKWFDMSALNDPDMRFQMMWSDPSSADVIPAELQEQSARFPFGRLQAARFLNRMGCNTLIRGHEKVDDGFLKNYDDENITLMTLFSAGGLDNGDLPPDSSYRSVTPKSMTVSYEGDDMSVAPWLIDYKTYNDPTTNAFFKRAPEIEHRK
jgi:uncharacterized tellurite resistance protein B-like protein